MSIESIILTLSTLIPATFLLAGLTSIDWGKKGGL